MFLAEFLRLAESRSSPPPHAADCNSSELVALSAGGELLRLRTNLIERRGEWGLCSFGSKSRAGRSLPPQREARNSRCSLSASAGFGPLWMGIDIIGVEAGSKRRCVSLPRGGVRPVRFSNRRI